MEYVFQKKELINYHIQHIEVTAGRGSEKFIWDYGAPKVKVKDPCFSSRSFRITQATQVHPESPRVTSHHSRSPSAT